MKRVLLPYGVLVCLILIGAHSVQAQALVIPRLPGPPSTGISLPIQRYVVNVTITEQTAVTEIEQVFYNPHNRQVEGEYLLALPQDASVSRFTMEMDGEQIKGDLLDKDKTYLIYCRTANRTSQAIKMMSELEFAEVYNMLGGIVQWQAGGFPVITGE